ncbi:hypothetical protein [Halodesulfovibrio sp.]|uniref:hypothetical protein n=1 Tax=Halodesulfovibrio sp. TaxID=1912772 RepID=UPI0025C41A2E|nr:hypothetical protein [Halodesulfovibrio sp.]
MWHLFDVTKYVLEDNLWHSLVRCVKVENGFFVYVHSLSDKPKECVFTYYFKLDGSFYHAKPTNLMLGGEVGEKVDSPMIDIHPEILNFHNIIITSFEKNRSKNFNTAYFLMSTEHHMARYHMYDYDSLLSRCTAFENIINKTQGRYRALLEQKALYESCGMESLELINSVLLSDEASEEEKTFYSGMLWLLEPAGYLQVSLYDSISCSQAASSIARSILIDFYKSHFEFDQGLTTQLMATDVDILWRHFSPPFDACFFSYAESGIKILNDGVTIDGAYILNLKDSVALDIAGHRNTMNKNGYNHFAKQLVIPKDEDKKVKDFKVDFSWIGASEADVEKIRTFINLVLSSVAYLNVGDGQAEKVMERSDLEKAFKAKKNAAKARKVANKKYAALDYTYISEKRSGGALQSKEGCYKVAKMFSVRGHIRSQAYGPNYSLRKNIWIKPYIKGKSYGVTSQNERIYKARSVG